MASGVSFASSILSRGTYTDSMIGVNVYGTLCWSKQCADREARGTCVGYERGVYDLRPSCLAKTHKRRTANWGDQNLPQRKRIIPSSSPTS